MLHPDADQVASAELVNEMPYVVGSNGPEVPYRVRFKTMFMGGWLRFRSLYPTWIVRLFEPQALSFDRNVNRRYVVAGPEGKLRAYLTHYSFEKGHDAWIKKQTRAC